VSGIQKTIKAHFIHPASGVYAKLLISHAPSVGDELRFRGDKFFTVVRKVWVYDEPEAQFSRLNIEIKEAP
jgi:hypothetical protein